MMKTLIPDKENKYILVFILSCGLISILPFLTLNLYEFAYPFLWTMRFLSIPFSVVSLLLGFIFFKRIWIPKLERMHKQMNPYLGITFFSAIVFLGLIFTTTNGAIFCNAYIGKQTEIGLKFRVLRSYDSSAGRGKITYHHVQFKHQNRLVDIYVKHQYSKGETLNEKLHIGSLNLIYSN